MWNIAKSKCDRIFYNLTKFGSTVYGNARILILDPSKKTMHQESVLNFKTSYEGRSRVGAAPEATSAGGIDSLKSIPGLLKS